MIANQPAQRWAGRWLWAAAVYNVAWGAVTIAFPHLMFDATGIPRPNYPAIWQCVGMIVGVYGVGYALAAADPRRHWPIVLVGLLGKVFGPIGFAVALADGVFPPAFGLTIVTNDLVWWVPFALILADAAKYRDRPDPALLSSYVKESAIAAPPATVFQFHESPDALARLIPPWEKVRVAAGGGSLAAGSVVVLRGRVLGLIPVRWVAVHAEYDPPRLFADRQEAGPYAWWYHRHHVRDDGRGGTVLRDEVEYLLPFGRLGRAVAGGLVRRKLDRMFAYRHEATRRLIESGEWVPTRPAA